MTAMKIEHPRTNLEPATRIAADAGQSSAKTASPKGTDAVRLSSDLRLADQAVRAAAAEDKRPEVVARARALYEQGDLGTDLEHLADRMIDALLHSHDSPS